ncbi:phosphohydrolase [Shouchella clausii]|uniref:HD domain-containing protein n=1 Tax=Shouchella tritolerans TaxID=2979466 RepID=UPI0007873083|nr:HD domain-containing protein [Shouchella tritolerans]GIN12255.1 phosphohydrolase [Shouchella clausii]
MGEQEKNETVKLTADWVRGQLLTESTGHDWYHIERVTEMAKGIAAEEGADMFVVEMAALLHDLADDKLVASEEEGIQEINKWLVERSVGKADSAHIIEIIETISFSKGKSLHTLEAKVVQDADRLDAIGAIGIARTFQYAGAKGHALYDPKAKVRTEMTKAEYRSGQGSAIHHFYEKLLLLKDRMNTHTGKKLAESRHAFMEQFLKRFYIEWDGNG